MRTITRADFIIGYFKQRRDELSVAFFVFTPMKIVLKTTFKKVLTFNLDNDSIFTINYRRTNEWASFHLQLNTSISTLSTFFGKVIMSFAAKQVA